MPVYVIADQHPLKQGLKLISFEEFDQVFLLYRRPTSTKTRIETHNFSLARHPVHNRRPTSTKTRIETPVSDWLFSVH